jgi:YfiH family protein
VGVDRLVRVRQVHGIAVACATPSAEALFPAADIIISRDSSLACAVQTADCVPLLIADSRTGAVAAVHCGWRGISLNGAATAVAALARQWGAAPADLIAALGPSIGACCYEVGVDVRQRFADAGTSEAALARWFLPEPAPSDRNPSMPAVRDRQSGRQDRWFFDGWRAVVEQLQSAGLSGDRLFSAELCTASHPAVFSSYRRDGAVAGRQVGVIRSRRLHP